MISAVLSHALELAQFGFRVHPVQGKRPLAADWPTKAALVEGAVRDLFEAHPGATGIGIATGNGLFVVDIDTAKQGSATFAALLAVNAPLPRTVTVSTGGGGWHYYFRAPQGVRVVSKANALGPGVDVRGDGGQVVAPPSPHPSGTRYTWVDGLSPADLDIAEAPAWLVELVKPKERETKPAPAKPRAAAESNALKRARAYLATIPGAVAGSGGHDATFKAAVAMVRGFSLSVEDAYDLLARDFNPRCEPAWTERELRHKVESAAADSTIPAGYLLEVERPAPLKRQPAAPVSVPVSVEAEDWRTLLTRNQRGVPNPTLGNCLTALTHAPEWAGVLGFDDFRNTSVFRSRPPFESDYAEGESVTKDTPLVDADFARIAVWLERAADLRVTTGLVYDAVLMAARRRKFHPLREYLDGLTWDGVERLETWLTKYVGVRDTPYARAVGSWWLISAVARVYDPGCKVDHVLVLEGRQRAGKSSTVRVLAGEWFSDAPLDLHTKDSAIVLRGRWLTELAELSSLNRADVNRVKQFITTQQDIYRPPFGRLPTEVPRQGIFAATTNDSEYLRDETGGRRFWGVRVGTVDIEALKRDRDQLWAEVAHVYKRGARWYPISEAEHALCESEQDERYVADTWEDILREKLSQRRARFDWAGSITLDEVLSDFLAIPPKDHQQHQTKAGRAMKRLGWNHRRRPESEDPFRRRAYYPPSEVSDE